MMKSGKWVLWKWALIIALTLLACRLLAARQANSTTGRLYVPTSLEACGATSTCAKTVQNAGIIVYGAVALSGGTQTVTSLPFTGTGTFICFSQDATTSSNAVKMVPASASTATITGTGTDTINYFCPGN